MEKTIKWSAPFTRAYAQRIAHNEPLKTEFFACLEAFQADPELVSAHPLADKMAGRWSFWLNHTHRVIYRETATSILLLDIGTHEQVYER
jgi:Txe/YoeB family toxin of Txe-Axe toxin-antitoxin module